MGFFKRLFGREKPIDLNAMINTLLVEKVRAEAELVAKKREAELSTVEYELKLARERQQLREQRRAAAVERNKTLPRRNGKLVSSRSRSACWMCDPLPENKGARCAAHASQYPIQ